MSNGEQQPHVVAPPPDLVSVPTIAPAAVEVEAFAKAAAHLQMFERLRDVALKMTRPSDWHYFGDRPWPQRSACEKIARAFGLNIKVNRTDDGVPYVKKFSQDEKGAYYLITVSGAISGPWGEIEAFGTTSSRDLFFAADGKDTEGNVIYKPFFEINEGNIAMAAYTNFVANAVMRYTGISGFTKADLDKVYGEGAVKGHTYAESKPKKTAEDVSDRSEKMKRLASLCMVMGEGVESEAAILCEAMSSFTAKDGKLVPGKRSPRDLTDGRLAVTLQTAEKEWEKFLTAKGEKAGFYKDLLKHRLEGTKPEE